MRKGRAVLERRAGRSVLERAGSVSAVANNALFPKVVDRFDDEALAVTPWFHVTLDAQGIDSAPPRADTACVLAVRTHLDF